MTPKRNRPGTASQAAPKSSADILNDSPDRWHSTPTADERHEAELRAKLEALGYGITVPCLTCGHPLTSKTSLDRHIGPKCAARAKAVSE